MEQKRKFICGYCGTPYTSRVERDKCEANCLNKETEKTRVLQKAERKKKLREIQSEINKIQTMVSDYNDKFNENLNIMIKTEEEKKKNSDYFKTHEHCGTTYNNCKTVEDILTSPVFINRILKDLI